MKTNAPKIWLILAIILFPAIMNTGMAQEGQRPKVGLVLSGGGAKGLAHIGVIKVLEEAGIQADIVTGTSMGSIIGALHAIGYSGSDLTKVNQNADWSLLLTNDIPFDRIFLPEKHNYNRFALEIPVTSEGPQIPAGLIDGQELSSLFSRLTFRTAGIENFDDYPLPYRCIAADIVHAKPVIFDSGDLATAMRSSMAIPSVFSPVLIDTNTLLVDGGVFRNFPVQEAIDLGADYIIGVYVGFPDKVEAADLNGLPSILSRTTLLSGTKDVASQTELVDLLIVPDMEDYGTGSFSKGQEIQELGEKAARSIFPQLKRLADSINSLGPTPVQKSLPENDSVWITEIRIDNLKEGRKEFVLKKAGLSHGIWVTPDILDEAIHLASGTLYYEKITYRFENHPDGIHLVLNVSERPETYVKAGVHYDNYYNAGIILGLSKHNFLFQGTKLNIVADISSYPQLRVDFNKYFGARHNFFASLYSSTDVSRLPVFEDGSRVGYAKDNFLKAGLSVNYIIRTNTRVGIAAQYRLSNLKPDDALKRIYPIFTFDKIGFHAADIGVQFEHNSLNNNLYPVRGTNAFVDMNYIFTGEEFLTHGIIDSTEIGDIRLDVLPFWKITAGIENFLPIAKKLSLLSGFGLGLSAEETALTDMYYLGGHRYNLRRKQVPFLGFSPDQITTYNYIKLHVGLQHETFTGIFAGIKMNYMVTSDYFNELSGNITSRAGDAHYFGVGGGITYKSPLGPLSVWFGSQAYKFTPTWYINFGFTF